jgi:hypothetical protein
MHWRLQIYTKPPLESNPIHDRCSDDVKQGCTRLRPQLLVLGNSFHSIVVVPSEQLCVSRDAVNDILEAVPKLPCSRLVSEARFGGVTSAPQPTLRSSVGAVASHVRSSIRNGDPPRF